MKTTRLEKGITLIALIITIIILLILAVVTIGSIKNSNIITYAQNAASDYEKGKDEEESTISGYEGLIKETKNGVGDATVGEIVNKNSTINGEEYSYKNPVIPAGFKAINIETEGHESVWDSESGPEYLEGLVISDGNSEFVWIPVENIDNFAKLQDGSNENYRGVLYKWGKDPTGNIQYPWSTDEEWIASDTSSREPSNVTYDNVSRLSIWTETLYQESFNKMVASVKKYGGFYIGRYETSLNGSVAQSKYGETPMNKNWHTSYEASLAYSKSNSSLGVTSEMIWRCQWDAMIKFILQGDESEHANSADYAIHGLKSSYLTGGKNYSEIYEGNEPYKDIASNIYDLGGNMQEMTQAANSNACRVCGGGTYKTTAVDLFPSSVVYGTPYHDTAIGFEDTGSRLSLYIDI